MSMHFREGNFEVIAIEGEGALAGWRRPGTTHSFMNFNSAKSIIYRTHDTSFSASALAHSEKTSL